MNPIVINEEMSKQLLTLEGPVFFADPSGKILGTFMPSGVEWEDEISDEELVARMKSGESTYTTAEVLAHLGRLP